MAPSTLEAEALGAFIDAAPSPFHAVLGARQALDDAGFTALDATEAWPGGAGRWYLARDGALVAWVVPDAAAAAPATPFRLVGAHTDSPNLRVKPQPDTGRAGWRQLGVEVYGGALLNSWLDRDLGLSGRVAVAPEGGGPAELRLLVVDEPVARVPQLAIHLDRNANEGLALNKQLHLSPVWSLGDPEPGRFRRFLAERLDVAPVQVRAWDLMFHDLTPSTLLGTDRDLLAAPRIDNLASCATAVRALAAHDGAVGPEGRPVVAAVSLFDHEEVGSTSATGADGSMLAQVLERVVLARGGSREDHLRALAGSVCLSADGAHGTHPNYADRHEPEHQIRVNAGPVLKVNANQRYATDAATAAVFEQACDRAAVPMQRFVTRTDLPCGSTIGPSTAARLAIPTVDAGIAQLSMHSARELCGAVDPGLFRAAIAAFLAP